MRWAASLLLVSIALAGCSGGGEPASTASTDDGKDDGPLDDGGNGTKQPPALNRRPLPTFDADALNGSAPLLVNFSLDGADPDDDALNWTLDVDGDGTPDFNGSALPATVNHTYTEPGTFNATYTLSDGLLEAQASLTFNVTAAAERYAETQAPITITGAATGVLGQGAPGSTDHPFDIQEGQRIVRAAIDYGAACGGDIDWSLLDPNGAEADAAASGSLTGEDPLESPDPAAGTWTIRTEAFSSACASYTVTVSFE